MKFTEEHKREIKAISGGPPLYAAGIDLGAVWAIQKFGGIQWKEYPETKPEEGQYVDIITKYRRSITDCEVEKDGFYHRDGGVFYEHSHVTHWAERNLPNQ